jgi:hypothetical protein
MAANRPSRASLWIAGLATAALLGLAAPLAAVLGVLLAPTIGTAILDRSQGKGTARITGLFGLAAAAHPAYRLLNGSADWAMAIDQATDPTTLVTAWASQGLGAILAEIAPLLVRAALDSRSRRHAENLHAARQALEAEWGVPPAGQPPL